jgi:murein DD-endopeptidase MepM/ murein hydrolase activator NlpD
MITRLKRFGLVCITAIWLVSCSVSGGYWIPPSAPTQPVFLPPVSESSPTPELPPPALVQTLIAPQTAPAQPEMPIPQETPLAAGGAPLLPFETLVLLPDPYESATPDMLLLPTPTATPEIYVVNTAPILYYAQAADTLRVVAVRFGVKQEEITSTEPIPEQGFINPGQLLIIPRRLANTTSSQHLLPDSEVVFSPSAVNFDVQAFAGQSGGYLASFQEWHKSTGNQSGAQIVQRVAIENSINPRLLLALLEYHSGWVYGGASASADYPLGKILPSAKGLYNQLVWTVNQLSIGYYAYREGRLTDLRFSDGATARLAPDLNAGTAALQYYFAQLYDSARWLEALDAASGFPALHTSMFGDPWERARTVEPLYPAGITQPPLTLPFGRNWTWSYTGGPHGAWEHDGAYAALDFAPGASESGCVETSAWATAAASGLVVRTGPGLVVLDLDGDGHEQTGWVLIYLHLAEKGRVPLGAWVATGDPLGHPSCEGGFATGTHLHIARKFNGEWVPADGPLPFNLGGWVAQAGPLAYKGKLTRGDVTLEACTCSNYLTFITRTDSDP